MIVSELIEALKKMPQDAKVMIVKCPYGQLDLEVRDVIYNYRGDAKDEYSHTVELDNWPENGF